MTMVQLVALFGQQILLLIVAGPVESPLACHYVQNVFKREIMRDMILICSGIS